MARPTGKRLPLLSIKLVRASMMVRKDLNRRKELLFLEIGKARIKELQGLKKALTVG